jgi:nucleoside-diphosphate-sugar epimerase
MTGAAKDECPPTGTFLWVDVRDLALAHVLAAEKQAAGGKRFFITAGYFSNKEIAEIIKEEFPDLASKLPEGKALENGDYPKEMPYKYDNSRTVNELGIKFRTLKESIVDTVKSLQAIQ